MPMHRPDHPDFWIISEILIDNDATQDHGTMSLKDRVGQVVDLASVAYAADQRALRALGPASTSAARAIIAAAWLDAFMTGAAYQARKSQQNNENPSE